MVNFDFPPTFKMIKMIRSNYNFHPILFSFLPNNLLHKFLSNFLSFHFLPLFHPTKHSISILIFEELSSYSIPQTFFFFNPLNLKKKSGKGQSTLTCSLNMIIQEVVSNADMDDPEEPIARRLGVHHPNPSNVQAVMMHEHDFKHIKSSTRLA